MEYCGTDFHTIINDDTIQNKLSFSILIGLFITVAKGIKCMHDNKYVHLDIKPANITIYDVNDGDISNIKAKLIDFGLSQKIADIKEKKYFAGTPGYMSPEMIDTNVSDYKKCDIYSLGKTFNECLQKIWVPHPLVSKELTNLLKPLNLLGMITVDFPENRSTIDAVITQLNTINNDLFTRNPRPSVKELITKKYDLNTIFQAGYTHGEISDEYNKDPLTRLLKYCDKENGFFNRKTDKTCTIDTILKKFENDPVKLQEINDLINQLDIKINMKFDTDKKPFDTLLNEVRDHKKHNRTLIDVIKLYGLDIMFRAGYTYGEIRDEYKKTH
jgi:serine/threonine protein kinase